MFSMRPTLLLAAVAAIFVPPRGLFVSATCYFRDGSVASSYQACPGNSQFCCKLTGTCATNGLCMDPNNYGNGTLANLGNGNYYNQTGLYQTPACVNQDFSGCDTHCTNRKATSFSTRTRKWWNSLADTDQTLQLRTKVFSMPGDATMA